MDSWSYFFVAHLLKVPLEKLQHGYPGRQSNQTSRQSHRKSSKQESTSLVGPMKHRRITRKQHIACKEKAGVVVTNSTASQKSKLTDPGRRNCCQVFLQKVFNYFPLCFSNFHLPSSMWSWATFSHHFPTRWVGGTSKMTGSIQVIIHAILPIYHWFARKLINLKLQFPLKIGKSYSNHPFVGANC